jgi:type I restriction enzyme S subunit
MDQYFSLVKKPSVVWVNNAMIQPRVDSQYYKTNYVENEYKIKQIDYKRLVDIFDKGDYGILPDSQDYNDEGILLIRGTNLRNLTVDDKDIIRVPQEYLVSKARVYPRDILLLVKGATIDAEWSASIVPDITEDMIFNGSIFRIRLKTEYNPYFIVAFMSTKYFLLQKTRAISNTGIFYNDKNSLENFIIPIPSPEIQKYIGDKVRRAEELREEAKVLKKEAEEIINKVINLDILIEKAREYTVKNKWLDSLNVGCRVDGQYYTSPITELNKYMLSADMDLVSLTEVAKVGKGFSFSSDENNEGIPYVRISDLEDLLIDYSKVVNTDYKIYMEKKNAQLKECDLVMAITGATIGKISVFYSKEIDKATLSADTAYVRFHNPTDSIAYLLYLRTIIGQFAITQGITGATNKHLAIEDIKNIVLPKFDDNTKEIVRIKIIQSIDNIYNSKLLIQQAKQDVENLIEGTFDMSKLNDITTESRC